MSEKNHAGLFVRLLAEALQADHATRRAKRADHTSTLAGRFKQLLRPDVAGTTYKQRDYGRASAEPQDL